MHISKIERLMMSILLELQSVKNERVLKNHRGGNQDGFTGELQTSKEEIITRLHKLLQKIK